MKIKTITLTIENTGGWFDDYIVTINKKPKCFASAKEVPEIFRKALASSCLAKGRCTPDELKFFVEYAS